MTKRHVVSLRLDDDLFGRLKGTASRLDTSPASAARSLLADALGAEAPSNHSTPRNGGRKTIPEGLKTAIAVAGLLTRIDILLTRLLKTSRAEAEGTLKELSDEVKRLKREAVSDTKDNARPDKRRGDHR